MGDEPISNCSVNLHYEEVLARLPAREAMRRRVLAAALTSAVCAPLSFFAPRLAGATERGPSLGFSPVPVAHDDMVHVPLGYGVQLLYAWGDPVSLGPEFRGDGSNSAADQEQQAGMHHDGMHFFPFAQRGSGSGPAHATSSTHGLLCVNHEYTDESLLHPDGRANWSHAKTLKSQNAHGVSVIEVELVARAGEPHWRVVRPSRYARRITARTPVRVDGPAAGTPAMCTEADARGTMVLGTLANCAMGVTPWGTYLTCEENFHVYFNGRERPSEAERRYGIRARGGAGYRWHEYDARFDLAREANEVNRFGWVVEIDPWHPEAVPVKHTALGRFRHEGALVTLARDRRIVIYMGDDEEFEYIYKYVSRDRFVEGQRAGGAALLEHGTLHVARFEADGLGRWIALQHGQNGLTSANGFANQAEVLIRTRQAADFVGATKMDRPEWIAVHPGSGDVYCALTNNRQRTQGNAANPRVGNGFGHIVRWREAGDDAAATRFAWDIFVQCGDPLHADAEQRGNIRGDAFGSPDGLWFDRDGRLWIQTDAAASAIRSGDYSRLGNNQMLVADVVSGDIRRFLTGPRGCEVTGFTATPDGRNLFVNVQHPGEGLAAPSDPSRPIGGSAWPANQFAGVAGGRPRSATVVIRRLDGGVVGA